MTKTQAISAAILSKIAEGMSAMEACRAVLGADLIDQMVSDLYDELRGQA
jgi:precorrin-3B methylase